MPVLPGNGIYPTEALTYVRQTFIAQRYQNRVGRQLVNISNDTPVGAEEVKQYTIQELGEAAFETVDMTEIPNVGFSMSSGSYTPRNILLAYQYSITDLRAAELAAQNGAALRLPTQGPLAVRARMEAFIDARIFYGSVPYSMPGIFQGQAGIPVLTPVAPWTSATRDQIKGDVKRMETQVNTITNDVHSIDTLVFPLEHRDRLTSTVLSGTTSSMTIEQAIRAELPNLKRVFYSAMIGTGKPVNRAIGFNSDPSIVWCDMPMDITQHAPVYTHYNRVITIPCEARIAGVFWNEPKSAVYLDY
jgi:hypothetical protein